MISVTASMPVMVARPLGLHCVAVGYCQLFGVVTANDDADVCLAYLVKRNSFHKRTPRPAPPRPSKQPNERLFKVSFDSKVLKSLLKRESL